MRMPRPDMDVSEASRREQGENPVSGEAAGLEKKIFLKKILLMGRSPALVLLPRSRAVRYR